MNLWVLIVPQAPLEETRGIVSKRHPGTLPSPASRWSGWCRSWAGLASTTSMCNCLLSTLLNQCHGAAHFHPGLSHKGTFINMELALPSASQGRDWFWTEYKGEWQHGKEKENHLVNLSEMGLHLPSGLPKELKKSLSSCCHQSDVLWEALEKLRASVLGQPSPGISGFRPNQQLSSVVAAVQELAPLPVQDLCHRHHRLLTVFVTTMEFLSALLAASIEPTPLCCSKSPLAATGRPWRDGISQPVCETCSAQTRVSADKQKLRVMLKGLHWVLSDQESQFLSQFHCPCWRLQEQQHGQGAEMSWIQQGHAGLQAKCQQPDGNVLWVRQNLAPESAPRLFGFYSHESIPKHLSSFLSRMSEPP
ncbi:uncharacterized protein LOC120512010 isoform X2 [Passer montanus]|uniref:uncharacterized protein LOC120512010 isoform X2 n=1 Tax=Passer montanus TaxID=9160 RepID=UPI00195F39CF|nr:uncharacterized protein LOC120512010 isoform X2 [Passer montanus]